MFFWEVEGSFGVVLLIFSGPKKLHMSTLVVLDVHGLRYASMPPRTTKSETEGRRVTLQDEAVGPDRAASLPAPFKASISRTLPSPNLSRPGAS